MDQPSFSHEEPLENGRKPDFQFLLRQTDTLVVGDVTSVSDKGPKKDNPIEHLLEDVNRIAKKHGSDRSQFDVRVEAHDEGDYHKRKVVLDLPKGAERQKFLKEELTPYISERLRKQDYGHKKLFNSGNYTVEVTFKPKSQFSSYSHPSFTNVLHVDRNPVWNALKAKANQLRGAPEGAVRLLILCDGGCEAMRERGLGAEIGRDEIVNDFLRRETGIDIVISMTVNDELQPFGQSHMLHHWSWAAKEAFLKAGRAGSDAATEIQQIINEFGRNLPKPSANAVSAAANCLNRDYGIGAWGGYKVSGSKIEISARALHRVLAGEVSLEEFNRDHGWPNGNRFATALMNGQTISSIALTDNSESDDDYVEITFAHDASLSPFR
jgi:hypothetical protein